MTGVVVEILRYISADNPGWVECRLIDAHGREWFFVEKVPVVTTESLDARSAYPRPGMIACQVIDRGGTSEAVAIGTDEPWQIESTTGETRFVVRREQLTELP